MAAILTEEDLKKAHNKISQTLKDNYDNKDYSPLTIHNTLHSFEKAFYQYSDIFKVAPRLILGPGYFEFQWNISGDIFKIRVTGATCQASYQTWSTPMAFRKVVMSDIQDWLIKNFNITPPIGPC